MQITSVQNPRIKAAVKLRDRRGRVQQQRLLIDGRREVTRALDAQFTVLEVFYREEAAARDAELAELLLRIDAAGAARFAVTREVFEKLAYGDRDEGLVVVAAPRGQALADLVLPADPLIVVLDGIEKPGNVGAILRTADAAGVDAVILTGTPSDLFNPNTIRASLGAVFTLPLATAAADECQAWLRRHGVAMIAARVDGNKPHFAARYQRPVALILGSESAGLGEPWRADDIEPVYLPMAGRVDSLNVSVAAGILLYEAVRQRAPQP